MCLVRVKVTQHKHGAGEGSRAMVVRRVGREGGPHRERSGGARHQNASAAHPSVQIPSKQTQKNGVELTI